MCDVASASLLPSDRRQTTWDAALAAPGSALGRARAEISAIWRDARSLSDSWGTPAGDATRGRSDAKALPSADQVYLAWYAGLGVMGALRLIEWRLAALIAAVHTVERYGHRRRVQEFFEGLETGL